MTNLMTNSEEDRVIMQKETIEESELSDDQQDGDKLFKPLAIRSEEKQLKLISRNQENGYIKLLTDNP